MPTSTTQRPTCSGVSWRFTPSVSTTSAEPQSEAPLSPDIERLPCLATWSPAPATTNAVAVETLKVPDASPPVPHVSISISRSVPLSAAVSSARAWTRATLSRITCAKPISSSTVSPFIRSAVRNAAICASVAVPDMIASIAAAASMRVRSRRSMRTRTASVMIGLVMPTSPFLYFDALGRPGPSPATAGGAHRHAAEPRVPHLRPGKGPPATTATAGWCRASRRSRGEAPARGSEAQVRLLDVGVREQVGPGARERDAPVLEHVAPVRELERARHVLLDEEERGARVVHATERLEDELHRHRRQAEARLVEQEEPRPRHEATADRAHRLLAAREGAGELALALAPAGKQREDGLERFVAPPPVAATAAELEVVAHGQRREQLAPLGHVGDAARDDLRRSEPVDPRARELDAPAAARQQSGDRPERRGLAGAVGPDQRHRLAVSHLERDAGHCRQVAVAGVEPVKPEQCRHTRRPDTPRSPSGGARCGPASPRRSSRRSSAPRSAGRAP